MLSEQLEKRDEFRRRITETDEYRNEKFEDIFPELKEMMEL